MIKMKQKEKSYDQLLGIMQGYQKTIDILVNIRCTLTNQDDIRKVNRQKNINYTRSFQKMKI